MGFFDQQQEPDSFNTDIQPPVDPQIEQIPEFIRAANLHNYGNRNESLAPEDSAVEATTKFLRASLYAGVNEFYNAGQTVGSWFGSGETQLRSTADYIAGIDSNLLDYYEQHKDSVDLAGFIGTSLIPGTGGLKVLNMGQKALRTSIEAGRFGTTMGRGLGLLAPSRQKYVDAAIKEMTSGGSLFTGINRNTLKALGAGAAQNFLEAAAFETAVAATMYNSPIFESSDTSDLLWNIGIGTLLGGGIGTAITHVIDQGAVRTAVKQFNREAAPWATLPGLRADLAPSDRIMLYIADKASKAEPPTPEIARIWEKTNTQRELLIREDLGKLTKGDQTVADVLWQSVKGMDEATALQHLGGAMQIARASGRLDIERQIKRLSKQVALDPLDEAALTALGGLDTKYLHLTGENSGKLVNEIPTARRLADNLKPGQGIEVSGNQVRAGNFKHQFKQDELFDMANVKNHLVAEARYILAERSAPLLPGATVFERDIPFLEKALREGTPDVKVRTETGFLKSFSSRDELLAYVRTQKERTAYELAIKAAPGAKAGSLQEKFSQEEIAKIVNVRNSYLAGERSDDAARDLFARTSYLEELNTRLAKPRDNFDDIPSFVQVGYKNDVLKDVDGNVLQGMAAIKENMRLRQEAVDRVAAAALPQDIFDTLVPLSDKDVLLADVFGAGRTMLTAASGAYNSLASKVEYLGQRVQAAIVKASDQVRDTMTPSLFRLGQNPDAAIEWSVLNARLRGLPDQYILSEDGTELMLKKIKDYTDKLEEYKAAGKDATKIQPPEIAPDIPQRIPLKNAEVREVVAKHIEETSRRANIDSALKSSTGEATSRYAGVFYPIAPNPRDYKHFLFVEDQSVLGAGRHSMIYAQTAEDLAAMQAKLEANKPATWKIYSKGEAERWYKAIGQFEFDKTLHDSYFNSEFRRLGISAPTLPATDAQKIVDDLLNYHVDSERAMVRNIITAKYEPQFDALRKLGEKYTSTGTSKFGSASLLKYAEETVANPYNDYIRTALGLAKTEEYKWWFGPQKFLDNAVSTLADKIQTGVRAAKTPEELLAVDKAMREYGYNGVAYDAVLEQLVNHQLPRSVLSDFGKKANAIMSALTLRTDWFNAINNVVGSHVLYHSQLRDLIQKIDSIDKPAMDALARIRVPGTDDLVLSPTKLHANAIEAFWKDRLDPNSALHQEFKKHGWITSITDQQRYVLDDITLLGRETVGDLGSKIASAQRRVTEMLQKAEKATGNLLAEEYNRFVAAHTAKQITDAAVARGIISADDAWPIINTFVNRTQGNYVASQRPALLQGAVGQMIGLFQTYQFNLLQQLLRHVGEGNVKTAALLVGLQGTLYGMNGLPAFNAINTHILGKAAGNPEYKDVHYHAYNTLDKDAADWLMYGMAANLTGSNLYVRGDINPRQVTVVPTSLNEIPIVGGFAKTFGGIKELVTNMSNGADVWQSFLSAIEHGSVNRPLQGLAQVARGVSSADATAFSLSNQSNIVGQNDLLSFASLIRLGGAKPFDEAIMLDLAFRTQAYESSQRAKTQALDESVKLSLLKGDVPSSDQLQGFARQYVNLGFDQQEFSNRVMKLYQKANTTQADRLAEELRSPAMQKLQRLLAGPPAEDDSLNGMME